MVFFPHKLTKYALIFVLAVASCVHKFFFFFFFFFCCVVGTGMLARYLFLFKITITPSQFKSSTPSLMKDVVQGTKGFFSGLLKILLTVSQKPVQASIAILGT